MIAVMREKVLENVHSTLSNNSLCSAAVIKHSILIR